MLEWRLVTANDIRQYEPGSDPLVARIVRDTSASSYEHGNVDAKIPRNHVPRSYRLMLGPRIVGFVRVRHMKDLNYLQVQDFCHEGGSPIVRECLMFLFTEATRCSGQTELRFVRGRGKEARPVPVPPEIEVLAAAGGIGLDASAGIIASETGLQLWLQLTGLSEQSLKSVERLGVAISPARICYLLSQGVWSPLELEFLLRSAPLPELILSGEADVEDRIVQGIAHQAARSALLIGVCARRLSIQYIHSDSRLAIPVDASEPVFDKRTDAVIANASPDVSLACPDWRICGDNSAVIRSVSVVCRARTAESIGRQWMRDFEDAETCRNDNGTETAAVAYPRDVRWVDGPVLDGMRQASAQLGIAVLAAPDSAEQLQVEVRRRFRLARLVRA